MIVCMLLAFVVVLFPGGAFGEQKSGGTDVEFKGKIGKTYAESKEWWPEPVKAPKGAPNVLIILLDDVGYGQLGAFGGLTGSFNETYILNGLQTPFAANMDHYDTWGTRTTYPHYHAGWAMAGNTPFKYFKQIVHRGGIQDPLIIHWPKGIKPKGQVRNQYHHIIDIAPTVLEAAKLKMPDSTTITTSTTECITPLNLPSCPRAKPSSSSNS